MHDMKIKKLLLSVIHVTFGFQYKSYMVGW